MLFLISIIFLIRLIYLLILLLLIFIFYIIKLRILITNHFCLLISFNISLFINYLLNYRYFFLTIR